MWGRYDPQAQGSPDTLPNLLNVAYFPQPLPTSGSPSVDGYIARIAVDVSAVVGAPVDYTTWFAGPVASIPPGAVVVLRSAGVTYPGGTATATYWHPDLNFTNWAMWFIIPEPTSLALLALGGLAAFRRR